MNKQTAIAVAVLVVIGGIWYAAASATNPIVVTQPYYTIPTYGATYSSAGAPNSDALLEEVRAIRILLEKFSAPGDAPNTQAEKNALHVSNLIKSKCSICHNAKDAAKKGGELVLFIDDVTPIRLSRADRRAIASRVENNTMPPPSTGKLSPEDKKSISEFFK